MVSFDIVKKGNCDINLKYMPDALFSWYDFYSFQSNIFESFLENYKYTTPFDGISESEYNIDFTTAYILMAGNSHAAHYPAEAEKCFLQMALRLKETAAIHGMNFYLIECCEGDRFLRAVSEKTGIYLIPAGINIRLAGYILGRAVCFISGRYHPSILASLGGTPCVFMGSNSHKTTSLQEVLGIPKDRQVVFSALPDTEEIERIVCETEKNLNVPREDIKKASEKNCLLVENLSLSGRKNNLVIEKLVVKTGTACSLRCEKCGEYNPYLAAKGKSFSLDAKTLVEEVYRIAKNVDVIHTIHIAGGEPFLHNDLFLLLSSLSYIQNINKIEIVTNGTVLPNDITLAIMVSLQTKIVVLVSDYSGSGINQEEIIDLLRKKEINHVVKKDMVWKDKSDVSPKNRRDLTYVAKNCSGFRKTGYFSLIDGMVTGHCPTAGSLFYYLEAYGKYPGFFFDLRNTSLDTQIVPELKRLDDLSYLPVCEYCVTSYEARDCPAGKQISREAERRKE
jgi:organic radical activating enzyme